MKVWHTISLIAVFGQIKQNLNLSNFVFVGFHVDDSEVTLNVCLGKQFSGGELFFRGTRCDKHVNTGSQSEVCYSLWWNHIKLVRDRYCFNCPIYQFYGKRFCCLSTLTTRSLQWVLTINCLTSMPWPLEFRRILKVMGEHHSTPHIYGQKSISTAQVPICFLSPLMFKK